MTPRQADKLTYARDDLAGDGTHPSQAGRRKVAKVMLDFFKTDPLDTVKVTGARDRATVIRMFREWIMSDDPRAVTMRSELDELRGRDFVCTCKFPGPCHGDVLIELANR